MKDKRVLLVFAIFLFVAAGVVLMARGGPNSDANSPTCCDLPNGGNTTTSAAPGGSTSNSTTTTSTTVFTSNEWRPILDHVIAVQNDILQHPNTSRLDEIMDPSCTCYTETRTGLQTLIDKKWHVQGDTLQVRTAAVVNDSPTTKTVTATFILTNNPTVDATGKVRQRPTASFTQPMLYTFKKNAKGVWLVYGRTTYEERQS